MLRQTVGASDRLPQALSVPRVRQVVVVDSGLDGWIMRREGEFASAQRLLHVRIDGEAGLALCDRSVGREVRAVHGQGPNLHVVAG